MFASVNVRTKYKKGPKAPEHPATNGKSNEVSLSPEVPGYPVSRVTRSLFTRRIQNLTAILHISLLRRDIPRAQRAFSILLRCERHGVNLSMLWELGLEILLRSSGVSKVKAEEFLRRVRLTSSDIGHHPTTEKQMVALFSSLLVLMIRQGKFKEALIEANNELLTWPYSESATLGSYGVMLLSQFEALEQEEIENR